MTLEQLKPQDKDGVIGQIISICNQVKYLESDVMTFFNEMEAWEQKEYRAMYHSYKNELNELSKCMRENLSFWNERLGFYHTSTAVFLQSTAYQFN